MTSNIQIDGRAYAEAMQPPNILVIMVDQWAGSALGCAGRNDILTPTIDQLARNGTRFDRAYSACPVCLPARRTLMSGLTSRTHGLRCNAARPFPEVPPLARHFRDQDYQTVHVGKLHTKPARARLGFEECLLDEEGRGGIEEIIADDYELFLGDQGQPGARTTTGLGVNTYHWRPWHLEEHLHPTNWTANQMARAIRRRDPTRPFFGVMSFAKPHPELEPLSAYLEVYRHRRIDAPVVAPWATDAAHAPWLVRHWIRTAERVMPAAELDDVRRAYYATCTHIDHQIRMVMGTLREMRMSDDTIVVFTADHGEMLGMHRLAAKSHLYEDSAGIPLIIADPRRQGARTTPGSLDHRLAELVDLYPTLCDLAGLPVPGHCEGLSLVGERRREQLYGEHWDGHLANRMLHDGRHKLIWYPCGNRSQLFDLTHDPQEMTDLADDPARAEVRARLERDLAAHLYGEDLGWLDGGRLRGLPELSDASAASDFTWSGQHGTHWPPPPTGEIPWR